MLATIHAANQLRTLLRGFEIDLPESLTRALTAYEMVQQVRAGWNVEGALSQVIRSEESLTADTFRNLLDASAVQYARNQVSRDLSESAERVTVGCFRQELMGAGGEELTNRLRPHFDATVADLDTFMTHVSPGMTAEGAIEAGPEATAAWSLAGSVAARFETFGRYAALVGRDFGTVGMGSRFSHPLASSMSFFVAEGTNLDTAGSTHQRGATKRDTYRAGGFQALVEGRHSLQLNSPAQAQALCLAFTESETERYEAERLATVEKAEERYGRRTRTREVAQ